MILGVSNEAENKTKNNNEISVKTLKTTNGTMKEHPKMSRVPSFCMESRIRQNRKKVIARATDSTVCLGLASLSVCFRFISLRFNVTSENVIFNTDFVNVNDTRIGYEIQNGVLQR